ncbi:hypothetical protein CSUI_004569 [Cystoisospora suis]|uniref:Uncharacterized protein n=1 Tax=Cystoisospora suis TaxID=483139 RepID=A0A2C6L0M8_9APIC|nr:hypothetical protein CSUI_004569 [Cystoisospora suis]
MISCVSSRTPEGSKEFRMRCFFIKEKIFLFLSFGLSHSHHTRYLFIYLSSIFLRVYLSIYLFPKEYLYI